GGAEVAYVADVEDVEASVGEGDGVAGGAPCRGAGEELGAGNDFVLEAGHGASLARGRAAARSARAMVAVPGFMTTKPPAMLARAAASGPEAPAASEAVKTAMTVSPAPVTSRARRLPTTGRWRGLRPGSNSAIPSRPRVTSKWRQPRRARRRRPARSRVARAPAMERPRAASSSASFGGAAESGERRRRRPSGVTEP